MPTIRTAQPIPASLPGLSVTSLATATAMPIGISLDRKTLYGVPNGGQTSSDSTLYQSVNDGTTWTSVHTFTGEQLQGIRETDDGEAIAMTYNLAATPAYIYRSTGWSTSHTTATWTKVFTTIGGRIYPFWSGGHTWSFGDDTIAPNTSSIGVICENGPQTTASGDQTTAARRAYLTLDYGATWTQIFDVYTYSGNANPMHLHAIAYDPWWDRIWLTYGDQATANPSDRLPIVYSDDRGATWTALTRTGPWASGSSSASGQSTAIALTDNAIFFGSDSEPGIVRVARTGYRKMGNAHIAHQISGHNGPVMIAEGFTRNRRVRNAPILLAVQTTATDLPPSIYASFDNGETFARLWDDRANMTYGSQVTTAFGPTYLGNIVAWTQIGGHKQLVGQLVYPDPGMKPGLKDITGDGTTTVFTFAHGLGVVPTRFLAWCEKVAGAFTVTADATNVIITFTTAPTNGTVLPFSWRAAA